MTIPAPDNYQITVEQTADTGPAWLVRVYKKRFLSRKRISSDWFLDPDQAKEFADQVAIDLNGDSGYQNLKVRKPGWDLHRASR